MTRRNKRYEVGRALHIAKQKNADHPYLENILNRTKFDFEYHTIQIKFQNTIVCGYCGEPATGLDHHPPLSKVEEWRKQRAASNLHTKLIKISCCAECNRLLGPTMTILFVTRLAIARQRIKRKYEKQPLKRDEIIRLEKRLTFIRGLNRMMRYE